MEDKGLFILHSQYYDCWWPGDIRSWDNGSKLDTHNRADSRFAPSQWEMALLCNDVSHWLGASLESALPQYSAATEGSQIQQMFRIPQCTNQTRDVHISILNGALWDIEQVHYGICENIILCMFLHMPSRSIHRPTQKRLHYHNTNWSNLDLRLQKGWIKVLDFFSLLSRMREQGVQFTSRLWPCNSLSWLKAMGTATAQHIWCVHTTSGWCMYVNFSELLRE